MTDRPVVTRRPVVILLLVLVAALAGYGITRLALRPLGSSAAVGTDAQLAWLEREFGLTPASTEEIRRLKAGYRPVCEAHCAAIGRAETDRRAALASADPAALAAADAELARLKDVCAEATLAHLRSIAEQMSPAQGARFLAIMQSRVAHHPGRAAPPEPAPPAVGAP